MAARSATCWSSACEKAGGFVSNKDLTDYRVIERAPIRGRYRDWEIVGPPPPAASGVHITQMLNILEGYDIKSLGFGTVDTLHLLAEVLKIAFADRAQASGDPAFVDVPVERITSKAYADQRRADIDLGARQALDVGAARQGRRRHHASHRGRRQGQRRGHHPDHQQPVRRALHRARASAWCRTTTCRTSIRGRGNALSIAPGKRVTTSMAPMMALRDGRLIYALGLPGGRKIFPSAWQALINLLDHGMALQEAVEAPRIWTEGPVLEVEHGIPETVRQGLSARGHKLQVMPTVAGGMNAIQFHDDGSMTGAACWRADGSPVALGGGLARAGVRFVLPG